MELPLREHTIVPAGPAIHKAGDDDSTAFDWTQLEIEYLTRVTTDACEWDTGVGGGRGWGGNMITAVIVAWLLLNVASPAG